MKNINFFTAIKTVLYYPALLNLVNCYISKQPSQFYLTKTKIILLIFFFFFVFSLNLSYIFFFNFILQTKLYQASWHEPPLKP